MHRLEAIREEIVTALPAAERPDSLTSELLDEVHRIDRELGARTLFLADRDMYRAPEATPMDRQPPKQSAVAQHETLF